MSAALRQAIATALSTVDDVHGFPKQPAAYRTGDGWPLWSGAERWDDGGPFVYTWRIVVVLPTDEAAADTWIAGHLGDLLDALQPVAHIDAVEPVLIGAADTSSRAIQFTARE